MISEDDFIFDRIVQINKQNKFCQKFRRILTANIIVHNDIKLRNYRNVDDVLYMKNKLSFFQKVHD